MNKDRFKKILVFTLTCSLIVLMLSYTLTCYITKDINEKRIEDYKIRYHTLGKKYHSEGLFDKALLFYKKALTFGTNKTNIQYEYDKEIMTDMMLCLYHSNYYHVGNRDVSFNLNISIQGIIYCPVYCNCFTVFYNISNLVDDVIDSYGIVLGFSGYDTIQELYDSFELQFRSEDMYMYRMWYDSFSCIIPLNISFDGMDLFYCVIDDIDYRGGFDSNEHMDCYVYQRADSDVVFGVPYVDGDIVDESLFVYHNRYNDTWWNHEHFNKKCVYQVNVL